MTIVTRNTLLIEKSSGDYPLYLNDVVNRLKNTCLPQTVDSSLLEELGFAVVNQSDRPEGDVVTESQPELINGEYYRTWTVREFSEQERENSLEDKKVRERMRIESFRRSQFEKGFPYEVNGETYHVQVRDRDIGNLISLRTVAKEVLNNEQDRIFEFRFQENVTVNLNATAMIELADTAFTKVSEAYKKVWQFKDQVTNANSEQDFPEDYETLF